MHNKGKFHSHFMIRKKFLFHHCCYRAYLCIGDKIKTVSITKSRTNQIEKWHSVQFNFIFIASNHDAFTQFTFILCTSLFTRLLCAALLLRLYFTFAIYLLVCFFCFVFFFFYFWIVHSIELYNYIYNRFHRIEMKVKLVWLLSKLYSSDAQINRNHKWKNSEKAVVEK